MKNVHEYLNELDSKIKKTREIKTVVPKIGIFWLHVKNSQIEIFFSIPEDLEFGEEYGDLIVSVKEHYTIWESLKNKDKIPKKSSYTDLPRGRIAYNKISGQYIVLHGKYINSSSKIKPVIKREFNLKTNTIWEPDLHYDQFKCWGL